MQNFYSFSIEYLIIIFSFFIIIFLVIKNLKGRNNFKEFSIINHFQSSLQDYAPGIIFRCKNDQKRTIKYISRSVSVFTGYEPSSIINNKKISYIDLIHPEDRLLVMNTIQEALELKRTYRIDYRIITKQNREKWVCETGTGIYNRKGIPTTLEGVIWDISERKVNEENILSVNQRLNNIIELIPDPTFVIDKNKCVQHWNKAMEELMGVKKEEILGKGNYIYSQVFYGEVRPMLIDLVDITNEEIEDKYKYIKRLNDKIYAEFSGNIASKKEKVYLWGVAGPLYDSKGKRFGSIEVIKDITEVKRKEEALHESEERFRSITESLTDYIYKLKLDRVTQAQTFISQGNNSLLGYSASEFEENYNLWQEIIVPPDREKVIQFLNKLIENKQQGTIEYRVYHKNGSLIWISNTVFVFNNAFGRTTEFYGVIKDITARKLAELALQEAEERYRSVFDQSGLISFVFDLSGKLIMQNSSAASFLGGTPNDFVGKGVDEIFTIETAKYLKSKITDTINNKLFIEEKEFQTNSGKIWLKTSNQPVKNDSGKVIAVQIISQDITEKKELDRKILNTIIETEEKERLYFAQEIHDGVGPIISAIKMYLQWLSKPDAKIPQHEILKDTEQLLEDASLTIREISFKLSPHILKNFGLTEALKNFAQKMQTFKNIEIEIQNNLTERINETAETILYRILCECINNTVKHANASKILIKFSIFKERIKIIYLDDGIGFNAKEALDKKGGNGLFNIKSRLQSINASFFITSRAEYGTKITMVVKQ